jgi:hypothetical protein
LAGNAGTPACWAWRNVARGAAFAEAQQLQVVGGEDRQVIDRAERVVTTRRELEPQGLVDPHGLVHAVPGIDDDVIECGAWHGVILAAGKRVLARSEAGFTLPRQERADGSRVRSSIPRRTHWAVDASFTLASNANEPSALARSSWFRHTWV